MLNSKVKKIILGGCMLVMAASLVGGCGSSNQPTSNKLIVGTNATFVPFEFFCWFHSLLQSINYLNLSICRAKYALTKFEYYVMPINRESQRANSKIVIKLKFFYKKYGNFQRQKNRCDHDTDCA